MTDAEGVAWATEWGKRGIVYLGTPATDTETTGLWSACVVPPSNFGATFGSGLGKTLGAACAACEENIRENEQDDRERSGQTRTGRP